MDIHDFINERNCLSLDEITHKICTSSEVQTKVNCKVIVRYDSEIDLRTEQGTLKSVKLSPVNDEEIIDLSKGTLCFQTLYCVLAKMCGFSQSIGEWANKLLRLKNSKQYRELYGTDGEPMEFE